MKKSLGTKKSSYLKKLFWIGLIGFVFWIFLQNITQNNFDFEAKLNDLLDNKNNMSGEEFYEELTKLHDKLDRKLRQDQEKISSLLSIAATQDERGSYPYVKVEFENTSPATVTVKGVSKTNFSKKINGPTDPTCQTTDFTGADEWNDIASYEFNNKTYSPEFINKLGETNQGSGVTIF